MTSLSKREKRILELLAGGRRLSAWDMLQEDPEIPSGSIYTTLQRMENLKKLVVSQKDEAWKGRGVAPRWYWITALGQRSLHAAQIAEIVMAGGTVTVGD